MFFVFSNTIRLLDGCVFGAAVADAIESCVCVQCVCASTGLILRGAVSAGEIVQTVAKRGGRSWTVR